ncbi:helix-turn-helix domain-containing protein [Nocardioides bruguierae]|uniref:GAF domain-containing protein n=1 Tax=Nocardioides bruguierae TaxID=2945102 RepID=A0A9X2D5L6_9ACTN|nr:GAF domain-containing protein [Nocardioides bruguierae]MCM0619490.1 GAF domain-containing protein [Nocardioides bruguierae]
MLVTPAPTFLDLLVDGAPLSRFDELLGADPDPETRRRRDLALTLRDLMARRGAREAELLALYETAGDLTAIRDVDTILAAIVRRARQLLHADMTYLSLNEADEGGGASYMKVTDGALTAEFRRLRLPLGTGLLGLVAQTGQPYFTSDYQHDERFVHRREIDDAVGGELIRAILGVPLLVDGRVIGTLLATHRTVRRFPPEEVSLLTSFAAHAAVALENARLFVELDEAHHRLREHARGVEQAARAHDRLTRVLLHGGDLADVVTTLAEALDGRLTILDDGGALLAGSGPVPADWPSADLVARAGQAGRAVVVPAPAVVVAPAMAGPDHLATLVLEVSEQLTEAGTRTLERGAMAAALVLLGDRAAEAAEERLGWALLADVLAGPGLDPLATGGSGAAAPEEHDGDRARRRQRARRHRVLLDQGCVVAVAEVEGLDRAATARVAGRVARDLHGLVGEQHGRLVLLATGPGLEPLRVGERLREALASALTDPEGSVTVGVVEGPADPVGPGVAEAVAEADGCLRAQLALGRTGTVVDPAGLGVARLLLGRSGPEELDAFVSRVLGPVLEHDEARGSDLRTTLEAWFAAGGRAPAAARSLHVHANTVAQRLARVDALLGERWREPEHALDLQLALRVRRLRT